MEYDIWEKEEDLENAKESHSKIQEENECRRKITGEVGYGRRKRL